MYKKLIIVALLAALALTLSAFQGVNPPSTLCEFLVLLGTSAFVNLLVGAFVAVLLEYWPAWDGFAPKVKRPIVLGFCLVVPVVSLIGQNLLCGVGINPDAIYIAIVAGVMAFTGSQFAHTYKLPSG